MMVARDGVEPPTPAFSATLCCVLNNLSDFRWPPKYLKSRERHANRGWESWVHIQRFLHHHVCHFVSLSIDDVFRFMIRFSMLTRRKIAHGFRVPRQLAKSANQLS